MRRIFTLLAFGAFAFQVYGQDPQPFSTKKNELNIGFFNAFELKQLDQFGLGYKRVLKKGAFRSGSGFEISKSESIYQDATRTSSRLYITPWIGYEFHKNFNRLQLLYGSDLVSTIGNETVEWLRQAPSGNIKDLTKQFALGLRPVLGLRVFINESVSISTETYLNIRYTTTKVKYEEVNNDSSSTHKNLDVALSPLGIFSINLHF